MIKDTKKLLAKKKRKLLRRLGHYQNVARRHFATRDAFFHFLFHKFIKPVRIFLGIGGIKPFDMPIDVVFESEDFLVINKAAGVLTHPSKRNEPNTLLNGILAHLKMEGNKHENMPGPVSRLDRFTSGLVLFSHSQKGKSRLGVKMMERGFEKKYVALVTGKVPEHGEIRASLLRIPGISRMEINEETGKSAHTEFFLTEYFPKENVSLVSILLHTGRTHQIRVHFASIGHPVVGDIVYGDEKVNQYFLEKHQLKRHLLHASELAFTWEGEELRFHAPLGGEFKKILSS